MKLLDVVESTSLQIQFVAIKSFLTKLLQTGGIPAGCCEGYQHGLARVL